MLHEMQATLWKGGTAMVVFLAAELIQKLTQIAEIFKLLSPPVAFVVLGYTLYNLHLDARRKRREEAEKKKNPDSV